MKKERATLLLIDEDNIGAAHLVVVLNELGYDVVRVCDVEMGLKVLKQSQINVVLATVSELTGFGLLDYLYSALSKARIPIILCSDTPCWQGYTEAINGGAFDYLAKPLNSVELARTLQRAIDRNRRKATSSPTRLPASQMLNAH
jgi:DNA-binding NtrC family response regulator